MGRSSSWAFALGADPVVQPRPLRLDELQRLKRNGLEDVAMRLAAGRCERCGLNNLSRTHRELCIEAEEPHVARSHAAQPWEPKRPRHLRTAA